MTCEQANELLPWLLNGTLDEEEARRVREHLAGCAACRAALADTRFAWRLFDEHVPTAALVAYAFDDLPEGLAPALVEHHVADCPRCAAELEMVRASRLLGEHEEVALFPTRTAGPAVAPGRVRAWRSGALAAGLVGVIALAGWLNSSEQVRSLEARLSTERGAEVTSQAPPTAAPQSAGGSGAADQQAGRSRRLAQLEEENRRLAARTQELARGQEALTARAAELERQATARPAPGVNTAIRDLYPADAGLRGGSGEAAGLRLPQRAPLVTLILHARGEGAGERQVEVADAAGKVVFRAGGLVRDAEAGGYVLTLPADLLRPGRYTLRLQGAGGEPEVFPFAIELR